MSGLVSEGRTSITRLGSPFFLVGYFLTLLPTGRGWAPALFLPGFVALAVGTWDRTTRSSRGYLFFCAVLAAAVSVWRGFDAAVLIRSVVSLGTIVGLLVVLRTIAFPLLARRYVLAVETTLASLQRHGVKGSISASVLGLTLGQLLAFAVIPLVDQLMVARGRYRGHDISRWAGRALAVTVISAVAFPTLSIAIDVLEIEVLAYLRVAAPLTGFFAIGLLLAAVIRRDDTAFSGKDSRSAAALSSHASASMDSAPGREVSIRETPGQDESGSSLPLLELAAYLAVLVAAMVFFSGRLEQVSYIAIISSVGFSVSFLMGLLLRVAGEPAPLREHMRYLEGWWRGTGPEVHIFLGGGFLLYALVRSGALGQLPSVILLTAEFISIPGSEYVLFSTLVFVLFIIGVHPTVSVLILSLAVTESVVVDRIELPLIALALMVGNVSGLMPSPFSALSNLRASIARVDVFESLRENVFFGISLLVVGNLYIIIIAAS